MNNIDIDIDDKEDYWLCSSSESLEAVTETMSQQESFVLPRSGHTKHTTHQHTQKTYKPKNTLIKHINQKTLHKTPQIYKTRKS